MPAMTFPRVHVILLSWNSWADTLECLETVLRVDYPNVQVIICDNASTDDSVTRIRAWAAGEQQAPLPAATLRHLLDAPRRAPLPFVELDRTSADAGGTSDSRNAAVVLIHNGANLGFAGGNNVGIRYAIAGADRGRDRYVCLLNNDTVVARDWLSRLVAAMEQDATVGAAGAMLWEYNQPDLVESAGGGCVHPWQGMPRETTATRQRRGSAGVIPRRLDFLSGACVLMRTSTLERIGLIDERYFLYCEDIDLSLRVRELGLSLLLVPEAEMWHKGGRSTQHGSVRHDYYLVRNSLLLVHKFHPALVPAAFAFSLYRCALPKIVRGEWRRLSAVTSAYLDFASFAAGRAAAAGVGASVPQRA